MYPPYLSDRVISFTEAKKTRENKIFPLREIWEEVGKPGPLRMLESWISLYWELFGADVEGVEIPECLIEESLLVLAGHAGIDWNRELKRLRWSIVLNVHTDLWHERSPYRLHAQWMPLYEADGGTYHMTLIEGLMMARFLRLWEHCADAIVVCSGSRIKRELYRGRLLSLGWDSVHKKERVMLAPESRAGVRIFRRMLQ